MRLPTLPYTTGSLLSYPLLSIFSPLFLFFIFHFSFFIFHFSFFIFHFLFYYTYLFLSYSNNFHISRNSTFSTLNSPSYLPLALSKVLELHTPISLFLRLRFLSLQKVSSTGKKWQESSILRCEYMYECI